MKRIKVLHLTSSPRGIGGVERLLLDMAGHYDSSKFEVSHCNLFCEEDGNGIFAKALKATGLRYFAIKGRRWFELPFILAALWRILGREQIDILHLHMLHATILGGLAAAFRPRVRTMVTRHYTSILIRNRALRSLDRFFTRRADSVIAISEYVKNDLIGSGIDHGKITVIFNGTDIARLDRAAKDNDTEAFAGSPLIGSVGSLTKRKGHEFLLRAMPEVLSQFPDAHLAIVGEGPEQERLLEVIDELGINANVELVGFRPNVAPFLGTLDIYVHPSLLEPFGIAILEAMTARKCVIACAVEGVPELISEGETGFLVPPADPDQLAKALCHALSEPDRCRRMGEAGRRRVVDEFSIERTVRLYETLYPSSCSPKKT